MKCKSCKHFERGKWHESHGGGEQLGGSCKVIFKVLELTNSWFWTQDHLYVQETFGCSAHSPREEE